MAHYLIIIVARNHPDLWSHLKENLAGDTKAEVILDRRWRERRQRVQPHTLERRRTERRQRPGIDQDLSSRLYVIVRCRKPCLRPDFPAGGVARAADGRR